jgi:hypothetical protein
MSFKNYTSVNRKINPKTWEKYYAVADAWLTNGYDSAAAYMSVYPNCTNRKTATDAFCNIKKIPEIKEYIAEQRQAAFDSKCIDLTRVTEELAKIAFSDKADEYISTTNRVKALDILLKSLKEDEKNLHEQNDTVVVELEEDADEDNSQEESV